MSQTIKEYEILYGSDFGEHDHKMLIALDESQEKTKLIPLVCMISDIIEFQDGLGIDICKDESAITIYFYINKVEIEVQSGDMSDWYFDIGDVVNVIEKLSYINGVK